MKQVGVGMITLMVWVLLICLPAQTLARSTSAQAGESAAAFYRGKTVEFVVPYGPGGGYDTSARLLLPFLAKHLGATIIVRNEPGAGTKVALNRLAKETNGLSIALLATQAAAMAQVFGETGVRFDLARFNWLGTMSTYQYPIVVGKKSGYKTIADLQQAKEVKFGVEARTSSNAIAPLVMGYVLGINVKLVSGYKGSADIIMALQRGEVDGYAAPFLTLVPFIDAQDLIPVLMMSRVRFKRLANIPTIFEVKKLPDKEKKVAEIGVALGTVGRQVVTTPGVLKERVAFLESALKKALAEPELLKRFEKLFGETIEYATGKEAAETINMTLSIKGDEKTIFGKLMGIEGY